VSPLFASNQDALIDPTERTPSGEDVKLYRYIPRAFNDYTIPPMDVDYVTGLTRRLHHELVFNKGELNAANYYAAVQDNGAFDLAYSDPIVRETFDYQRDANGFAVSRVQTIEWYLEDGTIHPTKKLRDKVYSGNESYKEGVTRRRNIIDDLALKVVGMLITTEPGPDDGPKIDLGRQFMADHQVPMLSFVDAAKNDVLQIVIDDTRPWLDNVVAAGPVTIRDVILGSLDIWTP